MRVYMQTPPNQGGPIRFSHLIVQEDLLAGWAFIKESGIQGSPGRINRELFDDEQQAIESLIKARDRLLSRGYNVVFVEGNH